MTTDHTYDLLRQLVQENESMHHIKQYYQSDSGECEECQAFWKKMLKEKEEHVKELEEMVKKHMGD